MSTPAIPLQPMHLIQRRVNRIWQRGLSTHHLVIAESGSGKTGLIVKCILPLCVFDRMIFIDVKNGTGDDMLTGIGQPIGPRDVGQVLDAPAAGPRASWYRLVVDPVNHREQARHAVKELLELALSVGNMVIAADEVRTITGTGDGALGLSGPYENVLTRGRSNGVSVVSAVAATDNMSPAVKTQRTFTWAGSVNGNEVIRNTLSILGLPTMQKIGSNANPYWAVVRDLKQGEWLYHDNKGSMESRNLMARTISWEPNWDDELAA